MLFLIDYSAFIALPFTFISVFCLLIDSDYRYIAATAGLIGFLIALLVVIEKQGEEKESLKISWQRIERLHDLLSLVFGNECSSIILYHYGKTLSKNFWTTVKNVDQQVVDKLERQISVVTDGWCYSLIDGRHVYPLSPAEVSNLQTTRCSHSVCFFLLGFVEYYLERAVSSGLLPSGRYVLRSCKEGSAIIDVR